MNQLMMQGERPVAIKSSEVSANVDLSKAVPQKLGVMRRGMLAGTFGAMMALPLLSGVAQADDGIHAGQGYLGATVQSYDYRDTQVSDVSPTAFRLQAGAQVSDQLAVEAHFGVGLSEETLDLPGGAQTLEIDQFRAVYLKPMLPVNPQVKAYGMIGYAEAQMLTDARGGGAERRFREYGASYGVGAQFSLNPYTSLNLEYLRLLDETDLDASSLGVGINMAF